MESGKGEQPGSLWAACWHRMRDFGRGHRERGDRGLGPQEPWLTYLAHKLPHAGDLGFLGALVPSSGKVLNCMVVSLESRAGDFQSFKMGEEGKRFYQRHPVCKCRPATQNRLSSGHYYRCLTELQTQVPR